MSKEKPAKITESSGADAEVDLDSLDIKDRPRLRPPRTLETTLFDRLERIYGEGIKRVLHVQYRQVASFHSFAPDAD
jgi:DNA polymerase alpha-associated DNA helicase A